MKKVLLVSLVLIAFILSSHVNWHDVNIQAVPDAQIDNNPQTEQSYYNLFITLLYPYVNKAIAHYYSDYMTYPPHEAPYSYEFVSIEKAPNLNYSYTVVLEVQPYIGPHLSVGRDRITFKIDLDEVKVEKYEHIESYELPPHYRNVLKKAFPMALR